MAAPRSNDRGFHKFLPDHLYTCAPHVASALQQWSRRRNPLAAAEPSLGGSGSTRSETRQAPKRRISAAASSFMIPSFSEPAGFGIDLYSTKYFLTCAVGGMLCCGVTHCSMTPVDVVKCNMQIDPVKYKSIGAGFRTAIAEQGVAGLFRGWVPTFLGYSVQGAGKYGFYELFKHLYSEAVGVDNALKYKTVLYLAASASAEFLADLGLSPFEAVKVRVQTQPGFAKGLMDGMPKLLAKEGMGGLYKGLVPLWGRQIPYTMMKFATFESTVDALYKHVVPLPKDKCSPGTQLGGATVSQAVKDMGARALLTRGLPLRIFMIGTLTAAQWGIYDSFKVFVGLPTTGGAAVGAVQEEDDDDHRDPKTAQSDVALEDR
ncbi:hypothetical protein AXG93_2528s1760 [Marchantia polymorpha subsp. ruderalis]|uniref:Uncharacterized protein n=1 Tax=Marchantia polymorpha subsp. ruderalis TaxID=1480154 RepID=A0A176WP11_MARPO|nr:hypothetical protein AXG93_2528s1760 [Marchantia polymorpha subsp. ruderalis]